MKFEEKVMALFRCEQEKKDFLKLPENSWFINGDTILNYYRENGDSRYPLESDGYTVWAHSSGYIYAREGRLFTLPYPQEGGDPDVNFLISSDNGQSYFSLLGLPVNLQPKSAKQFSVFTPKAVYYLTEYDHLACCVRVFAAKDKTLHFSVLIKNTDNQSKTISQASYISPCFSQSMFKDPWYRWMKHVKITDSGINNLNSALATYEYGSAYAVINNSISFPPAHYEATASRDSFIGGKNRSFSALKVFSEGKIASPVSDCLGTHDACYGDIKNITLNPGESVRIEMAYNYFIDKESAEQYLLNALDGNAVDILLEKSELTISLKRNRMKMRVGAFKNNEINNEAFNFFLETLKHQVDTNSFGKQYGWSHLLGMRDIYQQMEMALIWEPERCRERILESLSMVDISGQTPRQYGPAYLNTNVAFDWDEYVDQGCWVISTLAYYLKVTGDFKILEEICGYYEKNIKSEQSDTVLAHLIRIMGYLLSNKDSKTNCIHLLCGDWADGINQLGRRLPPNSGYGTGVSIMLTLQVYQNLHELREIISRFGKQPYIDLLEKYNHEIEALTDGLLKHGCKKNHQGERRIIHGWGDEQSYFVGSFSDVDGIDRISLNPHAFWVLSGFSSKTSDIKKDILRAYEKLDSPYGLRTFDKPFVKNTPGVGSVTKHFPGTHLNANTYIHSATFGLLSLFKMGCCEKAWEQLLKLIPLTHEFLSHSPYVMPNSYMNNVELSMHGHSQSDWQTGSAVALLKAVVGYVFGYMPDYDGVWIAPCRDMPFASFEFEVSPSNRYTLEIAFRNDKNEKRTFFIDGVEQKSVWDDELKTYKIFIPYSTLCGTKTKIIVLN